MAGLPEAATASARIASRPTAAQQFTPTATTSGISRAMANASTSGSPSRVAAPTFVSESQLGTPVPETSAKMASTSARHGIVSSAKTSGAAAISAANLGRCQARSWATESL